GVIPGSSASARSTAWTSRGEILKAYRSSAFFWTCWRMQDSCGHFRLSMAAVLNRSSLRWVGSTWERSYMAIEKTIEPVSLNFASEPAGQSRRNESELNCECTARSLRMHPVRCTMGLQRRRLDREIVIWLRLRESCR